MGALSNIFAIDFHRFSHEIIPALKEGESSSLISQEIARIYYPWPTFINLKQLMELFNADLTTCQYGKRFAADEHGVYQTEEVFSKPPKNGWTYEHLAYLLENLIIRHCARYFLSLGKIYWLNQIIHSHDQKTQALIDKWSSGANLWNHGSGGFMEGISGWIDQQETSELHERSHLIELRDENPRAETNLLDSVRGLLSICANEGLGLLYGNDLPKHFDPWFQYCQILRLTSIDENIIGEDYPAFTTQIAEDYR